MYNFFLQNTINVCKKESLKIIKFLIGKNFYSSKIHIILQIHGTKFIMCSYYKFAKIERVINRIKMQRTCL